MEEEKSIFAIYKTDKQKIKIIIDNILIMLSNRRVFGKNDEKIPIIDVEAARKNMNDSGDGTITFPAANGDVYAVKIIFQKITTTGKTSILNEFFKEYPDHKKIVVATDYNPKTGKYVRDNKGEIFEENALLQDIISHEIQPKFELLGPNEIKKVKEEYDIDVYTTNKLLWKDPVRKYFNLKLGDIIRVVRPSPTSGESIAYRIVTKN